MDDQLSWSLFLPLMLAAIAFGVARVTAAALRARGSAETADKILDLSFGVALLAGAWTAVLLVIAVFSEPNDAYDMLIVLAVMVAFFLLLLGVLFVLAEVLPTRFGRRRSKRVD